MADERATTTIDTAYRSLRRRSALSILLIALATAALFVLSLTIGSHDLGPVESVAALFGSGSEQDIAAVRSLRLPRALTATMGGIGLALAGAALQSVLENPLASSSTIGISQGAAFGATVAMLIFPSLFAAAGWASASTQIASGIVAVSAFGGALVSSVIILLFSRITGSRPETIILVGVALSALFAGAGAILQYFADDIELSRVIFWQFGDLGRGTWGQIALMATVVVVIGAYFMTRAWDYNTLQNGSHTAAGLGVDVTTTRVIGVLASSVIAAVVVSIVGLINFVGLIAPHVARRFVGSDHRDLLPASALVGACLLLASDIIARSVLSPLILPIGAITSILGAPLFLWLLIRGTEGRRSHT